MGNKLEIMINRSLKYEVDCLKAFTPPIQIASPKNWRAGVIFASPHSGSLYPEAFISSSVLSKNDLRRNEDAFIDELFSAAPDMGAPLLFARFPRCFVDVNRAPTDLCQAWLEDGAVGSIRANAGLGVIPTRLTETLDIYKKPLSVRCVRGRLATLYHPYHDALQGLIAESSLAFGHSLLIDCHSMPGFAPMGSRRPDIILGDRFGVSCYPETINHLEMAFRNNNYSVGRNYPYAGGYVTSHYGKPLSGIEVVQIEVNRDLYLNPITLKRKRGYDKLQANLAGIIKSIIDSREQESVLAAQ